MLAGGKGEGRGGKGRTREREKLVTLVTSISMIFISLGLVLYFRKHTHFFFVGSEPTWIKKEKKSKASPQYCKGDL